jgi:hypothetical protein
MKKILLAGYCLIVLTACSKGPSAVSVEKAFSARFDEVSPKESAPKLTSARSLRCAADANQSTYTCDIEVELTLPNGDHIKKVSQVQIVKSNGAWVVAGDGLFI